MSVSTLRPDSTTPAESLRRSAQALDSDITVTGAATIYGALNDNSDSSYCTLDPADVSLVTYFGDLTLPGGAVIKSFAARVRGAGGDEKGARSGEGEQRANHGTDFTRLMLAKPWRAG